MNEYRSDTLIGVRIEPYPIKDIPVVRDGGALPIFPLHAKPGTAGVKPLSRVRRHRFCFRKEFLITLWR